MDSSNQENHYEVLGIQKESGLKEIKAAYKKLALKYHPDLKSSHDAAVIFVKIGQAYGVLKNPITRKKYDYILQSKVSEGPSLWAKSKKCKK